MRNAIIASLLAATTLAAPANAAITFSVDDKAVSAIGDSIGSDFDKLNVTGASGSISAPGSIKLGDYTFVAGLNCDFASCGPFNGIFTFTGTVQGKAASFSTPYTIAINSSDTLTFGGSPFRFGGLKGTLDPVSLSSGGEVVSGSMFATITAVPEPSTWGLMIVGFGMVGFATRRRKVAVAA
jgi:hypothetical protein